MDKPWKKLEREVAALIGGKRAWANSGASIDCESDRFLAQVKLVARMSLEEITSLVEATGLAAIGLRKCRRCKDLIGGCVCFRDGISPDWMPTKLPILTVKVRRGKGKPSPTLVVMTSDTFRSLIGYTQGQP